MQYTYFDTQDHCRPVVEHSLCFSIANDACSLSPHRMDETTPTGWKRRVHGYASHPAPHRALPSNPGVVWLMHPSMGGVPFITLAALDNHSEAPEQWGIHYTFMIDVCHILCDSGSDSKGGFLSTDAEGRSPVAASRLLPAGQYYWHTGRSDEHAECHCLWKIVNSFEKWNFPSISGILGRPCASSLESSSFGTHG